MSKLRALTLALLLGATPALGQNITPLPPPVVQLQANLITTDQTVANATWVTVLFNSVVGDTTHMASGVYTPAVAGTYQFCGHGTVTGTATPNLLIAISRNGRVTAGGTRISTAVNNGLATASSQSASPSCVLQAMNGTSDTVELDVNVTGTGTLAIPNGFAEVELSAKWVSP